MKRSDYLKNIEDNNVSYWLYVRENLKPNDYVKLNTGEITRSINVSPIRGNRIYYANGDDCWFDISAVRNFSPNILELLEPMDLLYVDISPDNCGGIVVPRVPETLNELEEYIEKIKSGECILKYVVTHEQLEKDMYKVGE